MKKLIISKTIMFLLIFIFINVFITLFGSENTLIGVTVITAALMLLERDLTVAPFKNTILLLGINLLLGVLSFLASQNIWLGLFINFIALFIVGYFFSYNLKKPIYIAFGLQYLFMLTTTISIDKLPMRLLALSVGALFIMFIQLLLNKNKLQKSSKKIFISICDDLVNKINSIQNNLEYNEFNLDIERNISTLKKAIYDSRKDDFHITNEGMLILSMGLSLERISIVLDSYKDDVSKNNYSLDIIKEEIKNIKLLIERKENFKKYSIELKNLDDIRLCEIYNILEIIHQSLDEYKNSNINDTNNYQYKKYEIPKSYKQLELHKRNFNINSIRFSYALKIALATSLSGFIMDYFKIPEGRWIMFTVFSLIQPYSENCIIRTKKRIQGTLVGGILVVILFSIAKDQSLRGLIILAAGYIGTYMTDYKYLIVCNTISAIGSAAIIGNVSVLSFNRVLWVIVGTIIALVINKFVLPYDIKKGYDYLLDLQNKIIQDMIEEINLIVKNKGNIYKIKNLLLVPALIEERLIIMEEIAVNENKEEFIRSQKHLTSSIYNLYANISKNKLENKQIESILQQTENIYKVDMYHYEEAKTIIENINQDDIATKVASKNLLHILDTLNKDKKEVLNKN